MFDIADYAAKAENIIMAVLSLEAAVLMLVGIFKGKQYVNRYRDSEDRQTIQSATDNAIGLLRQLRGLVPGEALSVDQLREARDYVQGAAKDSVKRQIGEWGLNKTANQLNKILNAKNR